jgi:hypothetical protein
MKKVLERVGKHVIAKPSEAPAPWVVVGLSTTLYYALIIWLYMRLYPKYPDSYLSGSGDLGVLRASCIALRTQPYLCMLVS